MSEAIGRWLRFWFTFERTVNRREYLVSGLVLGAIKYAGDAAIIRSTTGRTWHLWDYLSPVRSLMSEQFSSGPPALLPLLALWSLPFLWIGISLSLRRALDAGRGPWIALLFFLPLLNYLFMAMMCMLPSRPSRLSPPEEPRALEARLPRALLSIAAGTAIGLGMVAVSVYAANVYGAALFFGTPFVIGLITAYLFNRQYPASERESQQVVVMTLCCIGGMLIAFAAEGALCLAMAAPLGLAVAIMGASFGRRIALRRDAGGGAWIAIAVLPAAAVLDPAQATPLREVRSSVVIDAPVHTVWRNVIAFPPLPRPTELVFRAGIAYPVEARIVGQGVGAVRYCVFSTGAFVEPITAWEPGVRLAFDVDSQPRPLTEWSPYAEVAPPHLDGYFRSRRGEFRLVSLPGGRTRLEGSTWYQMNLHPAPYWVLFGDVLIGRIHGRVLQHIKTESERSQR